MRGNWRASSRSVAFAAIAIAAVLGGFWLLPIDGQVILIPWNEPSTLLWPQMRLDAAAPQAKTTTLRVTDKVPWVHVRVMANGESYSPKDYRANPGGTWTWEWELPSGSNNLVFYHDCHTGCVERGRITAGSAATASPARLTPTKLGVVFASPKRSWHGRSGWDVELTYARLADKEHWGIDDLAGRVQAASANGLRVLVRVDYAQGQSVPSANDYVSLTEYLQYLQRLARDERLAPVYAYIIGSGYNSLDNNLLDPNRLVSPQWYARVFSGYGEPVSHTDNAVQTIRAENPHARVLVGPVQPWNFDQNGDKRFLIDVPWLNYMDTLLAALDEIAQSKATAGWALAAPDGFGVQAPGRPDAPEMAGRSGATEPQLDLHRNEWGQAQIGFRVYRDWLAVVNAYPATRGLPMYITSANTFTPDRGIVPAQNYVRGWLTTALQEINEEPQVAALCWFLDEDQSGDVRWDWYSLTQRPGRLIDAAEELDTLLQ